MHEACDRPNSRGFELARAIRDRHPAGVELKAIRVHGEAERLGLPNRWLIAAAAVVMQAVFGSVNSWSVFRDPLIATFGWSIPAVTFAYTLANLVYGCVAILGGLAMQRVGPRPVCIAAGLLYGGGLALAGLAGDRLWLLYLGYGALAGLGIGIGYIVPVATLVKWFPDRRGLITGVALTGFGGGPLLTAPLAAALIETVGVRETFAVLGLVSLLLVLGAGWFIQLPPEGYSPPGWAPSEERLARRAGEDATLGRALRTWQWYGIWTLLLLSASAGKALLSQAAPMAEELTGADAIVAAGLVGAAALANGAGRLGWSWLSDLLGRKCVFAATCLLQVAAFAALPVALSLPSFSCLALLALTCYGGGLSLVPALVADYFGPKHVASIYGLIFTATGIAGVVGPMLLAVLREHTGSYAPGLEALAATMLLSMALLVLLRPPAVETADPLGAEGPLVACAPGH